MCSLGDSFYLKKGVIEMPKFKVGDKVKIKPWELLIEEFGFSSDETINCPGHMPLRMYDDLADQEYEILNIDPSGLIDLGGACGWKIFKEMLELSDGTAEYPKCAEVAKYQNPDIEDILAYRVAGFCLKAIKKAIAIIASTHNKKEVWFCNNIYDGVDVSDVIDDITDDDTTTVLYSCVENFSEYIREGDYESFNECVCTDGLYVLLDRERKYCIMIFSSDKSDDEKYLAAIDCLGEFFDANSEVVKALKNFDPGAAWDFMQPIIQKANEEKRKRELEKMLDSVRVNMIQQRERLQKEEIQDIRNKIKTYEENLRYSYNLLHLKQSNLLRRESVNIGEREEEFLNLLSADYKNVKILGCKEDRLFLSIKTQLLYFEEEDWGYARDSVINARGTDRINLLDALFSRKCILNLETHVKVVFYGDDSGAARYSELYTGDEFPNSHIYEYNCWADNENLIRKYLENGDMSSAYLQIKSALSGLNISDSAVLERFVYRKYAKSGLKVIYIPEINQTVTIAEADKYFRKKKEEENANEND